MSKARIEKKHGYIWGIFNHKCSRCRTGDMFQDKSSYKLRSFMKMNNNCPTCGQRMEIEPGFYYGTAYVSYSLTVAFSVSTFVAWWVLIGFSLDDNRSSGGWGQMQFSWSCFNPGLCASRELFGYLFLLNIIRIGEQKSLVLLMTNGALQ